MQSCFFWKFGNTDTSEDAEEEKEDEEDEGDAEGEEMVPGHLWLRFFKKIRSIFKNIFHVDLVLTYVFF